MDSNALKHCQFPDGIVIKPDGVNEPDPCLYEEIEAIEHCTAHVLRCKCCGHIEVEREYANEN